MSTQNSKSNIFEKLRDSWVEYLHTIYVIAVVGGWALSNFFEPSEFKTRVALIALLVYFLVLFLFLGYFIHAYSRKARYAEAASCLHQAIHEIRDTSTYLKNCGQEIQKYELAEFKGHLERVLESAVKAYTIVTGTNCRAAIKLIGGASNNLHVKTLSRDSTSARNCNEKDKAEGTKHKIVKNSDFNLILNNGRKFFFCNDIRSSKEYINSSTPENGETLPYSSVLVLPIRGTNSHESEDDADKYKYLGFLAIDSSSRNVFVEKYDIQMGAIVADALYHVLDTWSQLQNLHNKKAI